jgi:hypothetical protein
VPVTFAEYTVRDAGIHQQVQAVLEDASADSLLDFLATVDLHHYGFDASLPESMSPARPVTMMATWV